MNESERLAYQRAELSAHFADWVADNEEEIISAFQDYLEDRGTINDVPDDFIQSRYESAMMGSGDDDEAYERQREREIEEEDED